MVRFFVLWFLWYDRHLTSYEREKPKTIKQVIGVFSASGDFELFRGSWQKRGEVWDCRTAPLIFLLSIYKYLALSMISLARNSLALEELKEDFKMKFSVRAITPR